MTCHDFRALCLTNTILTVTRAERSAIYTHVSNCISCRRWIETELPRSDDMTQSEIDELIEKDWEDEEAFPINDVVVKE